MSGDMIPSISSCFHDLTPAVSLKAAGIKNALHGAGRFRDAAGLAPYCIRVVI
jgi:hypothetical protein